MAAALPAPRAISKAKIVYCVALDRKAMFGPALSCPRFGEGRDLSGVIVGGGSPASRNPRQSRMPGAIEEMAEVAAAAAIVISVGR